MRAIHYSVPMVRQQYSPVCWLACATMIMQYKGRYTPSTDAVGLQGPDFRSPGLTVASESPSGPEQTVALRRLGFHGARLEALRRSGLPQRAPSMAPRGAPPAPENPDGEVIYQVLRNHGPFVLLHYVGSFTYGPGLSNTPQRPGSGHAVVVTGLDPNRGAVFFNNPWGQRDVPTTLSSIVNAIGRWERNPANMAIHYM